MITPGHPLNLPTGTGARILLAQPFLARWATTSTGVVHRPTPISVRMPFGPLPIGDYLFSQTATASPPDFVLSVPGAVLGGERAIVTQFPHHLITDSAHPQHSVNIFREKERRDFEAVHLDYVENAYAYGGDAHPHVNIDEDVVLLSAMEQGNFGAFMLRVLPKLILIRKLGLSHLKVIVAADHQWQRNLLEMFGVSREQVIPYERHRTYHFRNLIVPSMRTSEFFLDDETREFFQSKAEELRASHGKPHPARKIYVSRRSLNLKRPDYRTFLNESDVIAGMERLGFLVYEPELHPLEDQIATFAGAEIVVGPGGAGMFNTIFCRPGSKVISIEPLPHWIGLHANLFASMQHKYTFILGGADESDPSVQKRWRTDVGVLVEEVTKMLSLHED